MVEAQANDSAQRMSLQGRGTGPSLPPSAHHLPLGAVSAHGWLHMITLTPLATPLNPSQPPAPLQVHTICRWERSQRMVGYASLPVFMDPNTQLQPASRNVRDYVLNQV